MSDIPPITDEEPPFAVRVSDAGGVSVVEVEGDVDISTAPQLTEGLLLGPPDSVTAVVVDLTGVGFMDSSGLSALTNARRALVERGVPLALVVEEGSGTDRVLSISGLRGVFEVQTSRADALAAVEVS